MYETIFLLFVFADTIFTLIIALMMNQRVNELEECYNDLYSKVKGDGG